MMVRVNVVVVHLRPLSRTFEFLRMTFVGIKILVPMTSCPQNPLVLKFLFHLFDN